MFGLRRRVDQTPAPQAAPVLDLSGPRLRRAFSDLASAAEPTGGVERYLTALTLKSALFSEMLTGGAVADLTEEAFLDLAAFITPVRRRVGAELALSGFAPMRLAVTALVEGMEDMSTTDARMAAFCETWPQDKAHRWVRDLGAELLHFADPEHYPLMTRWVWDAKVATGVLREIWHADDIDAAVIDVPDSYLTFATLREELDGFLASEGVYRDRSFMADLMMAHIYAGYINDAGGQYLRSDFTIEGDPMLHTRRMLGLDAVDTETGRTRLRLVDGTAHVLGGLILDGPAALPEPEAPHADP